MTGSSAPTIAAVTRVVPSTSFTRFSGSVASSAPTTKSSRWSRTSSSNSSDPGSASARTSPNATTASSVRAVRGRAGRRSFGTRPPNRSPLVPSFPLARVHLHVLGESTAGTWSTTPGATSVPKALGIFDSLSNAAVATRSATADRSARSAPRELAIQAAQVFGLCGFALAQPLLDLLGRNATFFVAHDAGRIGDPALHGSGARRSTGIDRRRCSS